MKKKIPRILWSKWEQQVNLKTPSFLGHTDGFNLHPRSRMQSPDSPPVTALDPRAHPPWVCVDLNVSVWETHPRKYFNIHVSRDGTLSLGADKTAELQWDAHDSLAQWIFNWALQSESSIRMDQGTKGSFHGTLQLCWLQLSGRRDPWGVGEMVDQGRGPQYMVKCFKYWATEWKGNYHLAFREDQTSFAYLKNKFSNLSPQCSCLCASGALNEAGWSYTVLLLARLGRSNDVVAVNLSVWPFSYPKNV